ncbi:MAG: VanZ family protein [Clostridia bacterium]|jgi:VanZ family protein|nr:VanZ family protein [Clostridia bacterium]
MRRRYILWGLVIVWMMVIFGFSSDDKEASSYKSQQITAVVQEVASKMPEDVALVNQLRYISEHIVRKLGHVLEYFMLTMLVIAATLISGKDIKTACKNGVVISLLFAVSDELHQLYTPGRGGQLTDVVIDMTGVVAATVLVLLVSYIRSRFKPYEGL